ncbi:MAG: ArsR/SmtB family transcription factor [Promethearchaeota archaeon]
MEDPFEELDLLLRIISFQIRKLSQNEVQDPNISLDNLLWIFSNPTRRKILTRLAVEEAYVNQLIEELNQHPQTVVRQLAELRKEDLVRERQIHQDGKGRPRVYYRIITQLASNKELPHHKEDKASVPQKTSPSLLFPRLNYLKQQLRFTDSPKHLKQLIAEINSSIHAHQEAIKEYTLLKDEAMSKTKKIKID